MPNSQSGEAAKKLREGGDSILRQSQIHGANVFPFYRGKGQITHSFNGTKGGEMGARQSNRLTWRRKMKSSPVEARGLGYPIRRSGPVTGSRCSQTKGHNGGRRGSRDRKYTCPA